MKTKNNIRKLCKAKKINYSQLAEKSGVQFSAIKQYTSNRVDIMKAQFEKIVRLVNVLGCTYEDLVENQELKELIRKGQKNVKRRSNQAN